MSSASSPKTRGFTSLSLALQYGVPAEVVVSKLKDLRFEPLGWTDDPDNPEVSSVMDRVARRIALDHLPLETRKELDLLTAEEEAAFPADAYAPTPLIRRQQPTTPAASRSLMDQRTHYDRLAPKYTQRWSYSPEYVAWMTGCLVDRLRLHRMAGSPTWAAGPGCSLNSAEPSSPLFLT